MQSHAAFKSFGLKQLDAIEPLKRLDEDALFDMQVVGRVLPFRTNRYVIEQLIDWDDVPNDPMFQLTFPQRGMLRRAHFERVAHLLRSGADEARIRASVTSIRRELNPHPAGQMELNVPSLGGRPVPGVQRKYRETMLFFPREGQTCHAYCTYCFRWAQFVGDNDLRFASREAGAVAEFLRAHPEISDVLITGGDPMIMKARVFEAYLSGLIDARPGGLQHIRVGTKALSYWPYRFFADDDADLLIAALERAVKAGFHVSIMAHFSHPAELRTDAVATAIARLRDAGCEVRSQAPIIRHVNDAPDVWADKLRDEVRLGVVPYYMFVVRDTGAHDYFAVPLDQALNVYRGALQQVSGLARTLRGPSMSTTPGKIEVLDVAEVGGQRVFVLRMLQGRDPSWVGRVFFAKYDRAATWIDELEPAFGEPRFFFDDTPRLAAS